MTKMCKSYRRNRDSRSTSFSKTSGAKVKSGSGSIKKFKKKDAFDKSKIKCLYCNKQEHFKSECRKLAKDTQDNASKDQCTGSRRGPSKVVWGGLNYH